MTPDKFKNATASPEMKMKSLMLINEQEMDSKKELELTASPVKNRRREYTNQKLGDSFDNNQYEEESEKLRKTNKKAQEIEERGSRSPDKKKRKG